RAHPSDRDFSLAFEMAMGTVRKTWTLDYIAKQLSNTGKLSLKLKEKVLVRMSIYQAVFMNSLPIYAIGDQMVSLAKELCHVRFASFLNVLIHKLDGFKWTLPEDLSARYSFSPYFIEKLINDYGQEKAIEVMEALDTIHPPMMRVRTGENTHQTIIQTKMGPVVQLALKEPLASWGQNPNVYIQNATPVYLLDQLMDGLDGPPDAILDLCAAPGGKTLALHDAFPAAELFANEKSPRRKATLEQNLAKYGVTTTLSSEDGTTFHSPRHFDLIVLDVPCSNSGVLGKKPEARLRQTKDHIEQLTHLQKALLKHAKRFLKKNGQIWYLTCSILKSENQDIIEASGYRVVSDPITVLPSKEG
ncbi:MAG TPA: transcription antitermination factor NusB, partial [Chlamydiales bacterium]|nr:transcription antitermination factor NusB [Chlamydiales bacterium]